jgi:hypothetical protein
VPPPRVVAVIVFAITLVEVLVIIVVATTAITAIDNAFADAAAAAGVCELGACLLDFLLQ